MSKLIFRITQTNNLLINCFVAFMLTLITISIIALISNVIINPELVKEASFGYLN